MTTVVYFGVPAHGHVNPTLPVVSELVRRGVRVVYYNYGDDAIRAAIERAGAEPRMFYGGAGYDHERPDPKILNPGPHLTAFLLRASLAYLPQVLRDMEELAPDLIVYDMLACWGRFAARVLGIPSVCASVMFTYNRQVRPPVSFGQVARMAAGGLGAMVRHWAAARQLRRRYGVRGLDFLSIMTNPGDLNVVFTSREFQPGGEGFDDSYRFVGPSFPERTEVGDFPLQRLEGRRAIYVSMGTLHTQGAEFYRTCIDAFAGMGRPVVMAVFGKRTDIADLGELPENVIVRPFVPQLEVLKRSALFLSHGGLNSVSHSLCEGVPLLLAPQMAEQGMSAQRVASLGAGLLLKRRELRPDALRARAQQVLDDPRFAERAAAVGKSLRTAGGYRRAADEILSFLASRRQGAPAPCLAETSEKS
jgi:MGT family glycosyltransferase